MDLALADLGLSFLLSGEERLAERMKKDREEMLGVTLFKDGHRTLCVGRKHEESQVAVEVKKEPL